MGDEHSEIAQVLNNLALLYKIGEDINSGDTLSGVIIMYERTVGPDHPDTATALKQPGVSL